MTSSTTTSTPPTASAVSTLIEHSAAKSAAESLAITVLHNLQYQHEWTDLKLHLACPSITPGDAHAPAGLIDLDGIHFVHSSNSSRSTSPSRSGSSTPTGNGISSSQPFIQPQPLASSPGGTVPIISGLPPQHTYLHPDMQTYLIKHKIKESDIQVQREFVLPLAMGEKWSLARLCGVFDQLPERESVRVRRPMSPTGGNPGERRSKVGETANEGDAAGAVYEHKDSKRVLCGMRAREGGGGDGTIVYYIMQEGEVKPRQNG
ncbi:hypothetical protein FOPE_08290 [Fonsecaea pedrosoi]|nr:hypothetical protein FOPE_08290 [Fonsecaea pedrosoi]